MVVLSGAGLSLDDREQKGATWRGHAVRDLMSPAMWDKDPALVRAYFDERRILFAPEMPSPAHEALARLQHVLGPTRCTLVTQSMDGLLHKAAAHEVIETRGSLYRLRCASNPRHPAVGVFGAQDNRPCAICKGPMRPDVVFAGEDYLELDRIHEALRSCDFFMAVGTSGRKEPASNFARLAHESGAYCIEVNPKPSVEGFDEVIREEAETALPKVFGAWLGDEVS